MSQEFTQTKLCIANDLPPIPTWRDIWKYQCPLNMRIIIRNGDRFSIKEFDSILKIEVRDPSEQERRIVRKPSRYNSLKKPKGERLRLDNPILLNPRDYIVFMAQDGCNYQITATMVRGIE